MQNPRRIKNIAKATGLTSSQVRTAAADLGITAQKTLGTWLLNTDNTTAQRLADHLAETAN